MNCCFGKNTYKNFIKANSLNANIWNNLKVVSFEKWNKFLKGN